MKTLNELKDAITNSDSDLKIGQLSFGYAGGASDDIDIHLDGDMIAYIENETLGDTKLEDIELIIMSDIKRGKEALKNERDAKKRLEEAEQMKNEAVTAIGKVEAYEKLLIGRQITISK
jgi:hypothetical protein